MYGEKATSETLLNLNFKLQYSFKFTVYPDSISMLMKSV